MTPEEVLAVPMQDEDSGAETIKDYLIALLLQLWEEEQGFSGKRPFGNSGWQYDVHAALVRAGAIDGKVVKYDGEDWEEVEDADERAGDKLILEAIRAL